jgi:1-acyl-sn-glycerol-3-phosphate acyltransferase
MSFGEKAWGTLKHAGWWLLHEWFYDLAWFVDRIFAPVLAKPEFYGLENIPRKGAVMFTANHLSQWDIFFMHYLLPRPGFWMTKREYFKVFFFGGWARLFGAFPITRGEYNREALQFSVDLLKKGQIVVIFPEGHRSSDFQMGEGHSGAALVAARAEALIVPVGFAGTEKISRRKEYGPDGKKIKPRVIVRVGQPYRLPRNDESGRHQDLDELSDYMMSKIAELLPPEYQGFYAPAKLAERKSLRQQHQVEKLAQTDARKALRQATKDFKEMTQQVTKEVTQE